VFLDHALQSLDSGREFFSGKQATALVKTGFITVGTIRVRFHKCIQSTGGLLVLAIAVQLHRSLKCALFLGVRKLMGCNLWAVLALTATLPAKLFNLAA